MKRRLVTLAAVAVLALSVSASQAPAAAAPVNRVGWAYVSSATPNKGYVFKKSDLPVGKKGKAVFRSYLRMNLSSAEGATKVTSVRLRVPVVSPSPCVKGKPLYVQASVTRPLTKAVIWKKQPKTTRWYRQKIKCAGKRLDIDVTKAAVSALAAGQSHISFGFHADGEKNPRRFLKLSNAAQLLIKATFEEDPGDDDEGDEPGADPSTSVPADVTAATAAGQACLTGAARPVIAVDHTAFTGTTSDADGLWIGLRAEWRKAGTAVADTVQSKPLYTEPGQAMAFTVDTNKLLVAGAYKPLTTGVYEWRVQGYDDVKGGTWTPWCEFEVALPAAP